jgi:hypothetical protein
MGQGQEAEELAKVAAENFESLADALYAWGAFQADMNHGISVIAEEELDKTASELENIGGELAQNLEDCFAAVGVDQIDDEVLLHKEAAAAAGLIFQGYAEQLEKIAEDVAKAADPATKKKFTDSLKDLGQRLKAKGGELGEHMNKNRGKWGAGAAAAAGAVGAGAYYMKKKRGQEKTASAADLDLDQITEAVIERLEVENEVFEHIDELSKTAASMGERLGTAWKGVKDRAGQVGTSARDAYTRHKGKIHVGGAAAAGAGAGAAAGYAAGRRKKKK